MKLYDIGDQDIWYGEHQCYVVTLFQPKKCIWEALSSIWVGICFYNVMYSSHSNTSIYIFSNI